MEATAIEEKVDELLVVLDKDIQHIQESLLRLNELRSLVIKRDETGLNELLSGIQAETDSYAVIESRRQGLREGLATVLGCGLEEMTLSRLEAGLPEGKKAQVADKKAMLRDLTKELRKEHLSTALLLSECAKINRVLLKGIFGFGGTGTVMYSPDGSAKRQAETGFVNLQF